MNKLENIPISFSTVNDDDKDKIMIQLMINFDGTNN